MIAEEGEASNAEDLLRNLSGSQLSGVGEEERTQPEHEEQDLGQTTQEDTVEQRPHQLTATSSGQQEEVSAAETRDQQLKKIRVNKL